MTAWPMPRPRRRPARSPRPIAPGTWGATDLATRPGELDELAPVIEKRPLIRKPFSASDESAAAIAPADELAELMGLDINLDEPAS